MTLDDIKTFWIKDSYGNKQSYRFRGDDFGMWGFWLATIVAQTKSDYELKTFENRPLKFKLEFMPKTSITISPPYSRHNANFHKDVNYSITIDKTYDKHLTNDYIRENFSKIIEYEFNKQMGIELKHENWNLNPELRPKNLKLENNLDEVKTDMLDYENISYMTQYAYEWESDEDVLNRFNENMSSLNSNEERKAYKDIIENINENMAKSNDDINQKIFDLIRTNNNIDDLEKLDGLLQINLDEPSELPGLEKYLDDNQIYYGADILADADEDIKEYGIDSKFIHVVRDLLEINENEYVEIDAYLNSVKTVGELRDAADKYLSEISSVELASLLELEQQNKKEDMELKKPDEDKQDKSSIDLLIEKSSAELDEYFNSEEKMKEYLDFISGFANKYSFKNMNLIKSQMEGAAIVKSFTEWKKEGVSIKAGQKGLKILAPNEMIMLEEIDEQGNI
ncbi:Mbov_0392 family ICE element protein, partial [Mycoplasma sp. HS2188]|uniref:Mbov_0392 family ICE element protein n=1 Tax=Mycoplasma sp. HS2188 TaxID=2976765 RepID=UPI0021AAECF2